MKPILFLIVLEVTTILVVATTLAAWPVGPIVVSFEGFANVALHSGSGDFYLLQYLMVKEKKQKEFVLISDIPAGFPSPAADNIQQNLDLNRLLISHPSATFFVKVLGFSMKNSGINSGDILVVDRAVDPKEGNIVVVILEGNFTVKRYSQKGGVVTLSPDNSDFMPIIVEKQTDMEIWGVVMYVIHKAL